MTWAGSCGELSPRPLAGGAAHNGGRPGGAGPKDIKDVLKGSPRTKDILGGHVGMPTSVVNINVHGIGTAVRPLDPGEDDVWVSVEQFEQVLDAVVGRDDVRITFDDGNTSD